MLFTVNEGDVVRPTDNPHKVGVVHAWHSTGSHTLVNVKFHGSGTQENFSSRALDLVAPAKPKKSKAALSAAIASFVVMFIAVTTSVDVLVRYYGFSNWADWSLTGGGVVLGWGIIESKYKNRGRTKIKANRNVAVTKSAK
jgi:hypothetical protein